MSGQVQTYLNFDGRAEEALNFYAEVFNSKVEGIMRWGDMPGTTLPDSARNLVMNAQVFILGGHSVMCADVLDPAIDPMFERYNLGNAITVVLSPETRAEADRLFAELSAGGSADMPMEEAFWGDYFGQLKDKFGIPWMIVTTAKN